MTVDEDHKDQICDCMLVSSPRKDCQSPSAGRDRGRVILTNNNGLVSATYPLCQFYGFHGGTAHVWLH
ncbi:hypothetical protein OIU76_016354 [Salix suchowensis]|nr:hypothetical protein OIU76_016354 [Salix suchowensis]